MSTILLQRELLHIDISIKDLLQKHFNYCSWSSKCIWSLYATSLIHNMTYQA